MERLTDGSWVVGVDGSDASGRALAWALAHAAPDTEVVAIRAWMPPVRSTASIEPILGVGVDGAEIEQALREHTAEFVAAVDNPRDARITWAVRAGGATEVLMGACDDAALLVVGNRGIGGFGRLLLGSVSSQCATHATVPTVVVPADHVTDPLGSILVGFDGSDNSVGAVRAALSLADDACAITAVGVAATSTALMPYPDIAARAERELDELHEAALVRTVEAAGVERDRIERQFRRGDVERVLYEMSGDHDLLVVGARGQGAIASALLGSVSTWLLHHLRGPIMVVPPPMIGTD